MRTNPPELSIIIPTYNSSEVIVRCLDSLTNQSFKDTEIIVVDDCSQDNTQETVLKYSKKSRTKIRLISCRNKQYNGGARNIGIKESKGNTIAFIDHDDWVDTDMYSVLIDDMHENESDISVCGVSREYENPKSFSPRYTYRKNNVVSGRYALGLLSNKINQDISISAICSNKIYKKEFLTRNKINFLEMNHSADDYFTFLSLYYAETISIVPNVVYHYYQCSSSLAHCPTKTSIDDLIVAFDRIRYRLNEERNFQNYKKEYYSFFEKCVGFLIEMYFDAVQNNDDRLEYLIYLANLSKNVLEVSDFLGHVGPRRIRKFFEV